MKYVLSAFILTVSLTVAHANPAVTYQWDSNQTFHDNVKITGFSVWKETAPVFITFDNGSRCYNDNTEKYIYSLALTLYSTGKPTNILCIKNQTTSYGRMSGERMNQMWM